MLLCVTQWELYFTIDGERVSVFEDEVIESFTLPDVDGILVVMG